MFSRARVRHLLRGGAFAALASLAGVGCADNQDYLIVDNAVWFDSRDNCALSASSPTPLAMTVDVSFDTRIGMAFVVSNRQSPNGNSNSGVDDSEVQIQTAEVSLAGAASDTFELPVPSNSIPGGESEVILVQVPTEVVTAIRGSVGAGDYETLEMAVVFKGQRTGSVGKTKLGEVETRPYIYPLEVCNGCLAACDYTDSCDPSCPTATEWVGACGFAQGVSIYHPSCDA
jgi:hypothetical protein